MEVPSSFAKAYEDAEKELLNNLPPWGKASAAQRVKLLLYWLTVAFPIVLLQALVISSCLIYLKYYLLPLLVYTDERPDLYYYHSSEEFEIAQVKGTAAATILSICLLLFQLSHLQAILVHPGRIPADSLWEIHSDSDSEPEDSDDLFVERRRDGSRRTCSMCQRKKPDRTHHCKQCEECVLQMDHHCNWIGNCVGFFNFKYFFLMVFYGTLMTVLYLATFWETVLVVLNDVDTSLGAASLAVAYYSFLLVLGVALLSFLGLHLWMITRNYSTIEYCEKKRHNAVQYQQSPFDKGCFHNWQNALGQRYCLWLLPVNSRLPEESGLFYC